MRKTLVILCLLTLSVTGWTQIPKVELEPFRKYGTDNNRAEVSADEILNAITEERNIDVNYAVINGNLATQDIIKRLTKDEANKGIINVNVNIAYSEIRDPVDFSSAIFTRPVSFASTTFSEDANFGDAEFSKTADFSSTTFSKDANFSSAAFNGVAYFMSASFSERTPANFGYTTFNEAAFFWFTTFDGFAYFRDARFSGTANFLRTTFTKPVSFGSAIFTGSVDFSSATFKDPIDFNYAAFSGDACFTFATFNEAKYVFATFSEAANFGSAAFRNSADFRSATFHSSVDFNSATFNDLLDLSSAIFSGVVRFTSARFSQAAIFYDVKMEYPADFSRLTFYKNTVFRGLWNTTLGRAERFHLTVTSFDGLNTNIVMDTSKNPGLKRYIDDELWIKSWREQGQNWHQKAWYEFWFILWELTSHCGRSIGLWATWSAFLAIMFGFLLRGHIKVESVDNWYTPFYFSVVTFTTLGFGDVRPSDWVGQIWITLEVISGYVMLGGLISIFANNLARRS